jgi:molybdenum cofactor cytidylyltransferase
LNSELEEVNVIFSERNRVVRDRVKEYPPLLRERIKLVRNPYPRRGMSASIRRGLVSLHSDAQGVLIVLGDQPLLKKRTVNALIHAFTPGEGKIVVPFYGGKRGNPVLFDRSYIEELSRLRGDVGGRSVIESHPDKVIRVRTRSEAVVKDIDTREEYERQQAEDRR